MRDVRTLQTLQQCTFTSFSGSRSTVPLMLGCFPVGTGNLMHTYVEHGHQRAEAAAATARPGCQELAGALACIFTMARICTE